MDNLIDIEEYSMGISKAVRYHGYTDYNYGKCLAETIVEYKPKQILEFGSGIGYSTLNLALGCYINNMGSIFTRDIWETQSVGHFHVHHKVNFISNIKKFPDLESFIDYETADYNVWLNSGDTNFDLIYFDINNDGDKILEIYHKLNVKENKGKILLFEGGHLQRNDRKYQNIRPIFDSLVQETTNSTLIYNKAPGIIKIVL